MFNRTNQPTVTFIDDTHAWRKLQQGDTHALGYFYDTYIDDLVAFGYSLQLEKSEIKDAIHDMFLDLYKYHASLTMVSNTRHYLLTSFKRQALREKKRHKVVRLQDVETTYKKASEPIEESVEAVIIKLETDVERNADIGHALNGLTQYQSKVIKMKFQENKSYAEIADELDISTESVRTLIYRILKKLRKVAISFFSFI